MPSLTDRDFCENGPRMKFGRMDISVIPMGVLNEITSNSVQMHSFFESGGYLMP
jgi:hypothetical protein